MIELISSIFEIGDIITIEYGNPINSVSGKIFKILSSSIALKLDNDSIVGIKGDEIISFNSNTDSSSGITQQTTSLTCDNLQEDTYPLEEEKIELKSGDIEHKQSEITSSITGKQPLIESQYKPGDVIPLAVLEKIDPKIKKKKSLSNNNQQREKEQLPDTRNPIDGDQTANETIKQSKEKKKAKIVGNSFEALAPLVQDIHEQENLKIVPAIGTVINVWEERRFGFIHNQKTGHDLYFSFNDIIDNIKPSRYQGLVFTESTNSQGYKAVSIHRPATVKDFLILAENQANNNNIEGALDILEQILLQYPENYDAIKYKNKYEKLYRPYKKPHLHKSIDSLYSKANDFKLRKKYEEAIKWYKQAIIDRNKTVSAIKDLAMLYVALFRSNYNEQSSFWKEEAIKLIEQNGHLLPQNISTWNFLLNNFYFPLGNYEKSIEIIETLLEERFIKSDNIRYSMLLHTKAYNFLRLNKLEEAQETIEEALSFNPQNSAAIQLKEQIENIDITDQEQLEKLANATEFNLVTGGLSPFIIQTLDNYDEYAGVKTKDIESRNFTLSTLKDVREVIEKAGSARAKERASYLLTEGKLMQELEPAEEIKLRRVMSRYCNAMALSHISENSPLDIIRFYYNESFALEENWDSNVRQVSLYLLTHVRTYTELINDSRKGMSTENVLNLLLPIKEDTRLWDNILSMCLYNGTIFAQLFGRIFLDKKWKEKAFEMLKRFNVDGPKINISQNEFIDIWNLVRENRLNQQKQIMANIKSLGNCSSIEEAVSQLDGLRNYKEEWLLSLDLHRLNTIINFINPALESFVRSHGYRNKESYYNNALGQIQQLIDDITYGPTKLSYEAILPLLTDISRLLKQAFEEVVILSEPKITLTLLSTETVVNENDTVYIQIKVENHRDSSPVKEVVVEVIEGNGVTFIKDLGTQLHYNAIDGDKSEIFKLFIKINDEIMRNKATALNLLCRYKSGEDIRETTSQVTLKLYSQDEYKPINNPYAPIADGGPVPIDSPMFYGREEFITNIANAITNSPSKQIIIYGQKRCGKSSVMLHLKEYLEIDGKNFCVFFSIGDIIQHLSESSFYHKILSSIKDELDDREFDGKTVPDFPLPDVLDFKNEDPDNPLNTFTKYMRMFKRACKQTKGWENINIVVMIDEFTYLYTEIKKNHISPSIMKQWKAVTQNEKAQFSVVLVGQDVVPSFKKEDYARNAFGVIEDIRLTYLNEEPARDLIDKPILDENGESRYIDNAISKIIEYTSRNPYYIQIFCARLVDYMNRNKSIKVTEADVNEVAKSFVFGEQALEEDKFDNLIRAGETEDLQEYPESEILAILRQIAIGSKNIGYCCTDDINILDDKNREKEIIKHLIDREVLEQKGKNNYRIQVKLFQEWLLNH